MQKAVRVATARLLGDLGAGGCRLSVSVAVAMRGVNRRSVSQSQRARADQPRQTTPYTVSTWALSRAMGMVCRAAPLATSLSGYPLLFVVLAATSIGKWLFSSVLLVHLLNLVPLRWTKHGGRFSCISKLF